MTILQKEIEQKLFSKRRGRDKPGLFYYDVTSSYLEGEHNQLAAYGSNRDKKKVRLLLVCCAMSKGNRCLWMCSLAIPRTPILSQVH